MRLDLNLVEVFCCVCEEGSFSKAAERLYLSQPTISGHIKNLEDYVGAKLLDRLPRRIALTSAGKILYKRGRAILDEKEAAIQELKKLLNYNEGSIVLCSSTIPGEYLLPRLIASFRRSYPAVKIELRILDSKAVCDEVIEGRAEIGFAGAKIEAVGLEYERFAYDELALIAPNNEEWRGVESVTLEQLSQLPFLSREQGSGTRLAFEKAVDRSIDEFDDFNVVGCFGSTSSIKEAIKAGLGASALSLLAVEPEITNGSLKAIKIEGVGKIKREFFAVTNKGRTLSPIAEAFLDHALGNVKAVSLPAAI